MVGVTKRAVDASANDANDSRTDADATSREGASSKDIWRHRDLLDVDVLGIDELETVMDTADAMQEVLSRQIPKAPTLRGRTVATVFYEASTRTRASFEWAVKALSGDVVNLAAASSSVAKGESLVDTVRTLQSMGAGAIVLRHPQSGAAGLAARYADVPVINAGDGRHAHPTQALLDLYTMRAHWKESAVGMESRKVAIVGDILHSRVARSNVWALTGMGVHVVLCGPAMLAPEELTESYRRSGRDVEITTDIDVALEDADAVIALRLQQERQTQGLLPSIRSYVRGYQIDEQRMDRAKPDAMLMHPGPINEGVEVTSSVAAGHRSVVQEQVQRGVAVRMAALFLTMVVPHDGVEPNDR
jgi:aspartate carbamoyltransferase catalytic subunit